MYRHPLHLLKASGGGGSVQLNQLYLMPANPNNENCLLRIMSIYNSQNLLKLVLDLPFSVSIASLGQ